MCSGRPPSEPPSTRTPGRASSLSVTSDPANPHSWSSSTFTAVTVTTASSGVRVSAAGSGIMAAGVEGAGVDQSIGINIRLPFEQEPSPLLAADPKLVDMKYFFTRKLMLVKESAGFAVLPGGFGTQDEAFELLTLLQTGKAAPAPIVLLDVPDGTYWQSWDRFVRDELASRGLIDADDHSLYFITDDVGAASAEIRGFYRSYHSIRYVGQTLVIRLQPAPAPEQ